MTVMKHFALILLAALTWSVNAQTTCVDPLACNFTELGECEFLDDNGMPCVTEGCAITGACNFNPEANINDGSCEFTSCLGCTDEAACNYDPEAVYLDLSCIYFVDCNGVCGGDWIEDECGNCYAPVPDFVSLTLTPCGASGRLGPNQGDCDSQYGPGVVTVIDGYQQLIVPATGVYRIEAIGACGGSPVETGQNGGLGARMSGDFNLTQGDTLHILVGQKGLSWSHTGGGGGATSIGIESSIQNSDPIIVAGGGGGGGDSGGDGFDASIFESGVSGHPNYGAGENGFGNENQDNGGWGSGGGGFYGDGTGSYVNNGQPGIDGLIAHSFISGGSGSTGPINGINNNGNCDGATGGFGSGGSGACNGGGGGGGYSGGGQGGGGGGSFNSGLNQENINGYGTGDGYVTISVIGELAPDCELGCVVAEACNFNPEATNDDGSCDFCFCGPGTEYDIEQGQCMIVNGSSDINGDGCTNLNDLLDLLSGYGTCED